jgi:FHA domain
MARLILDRRGERFAVEVQDGTYVIGRDGRADIAIPDHTVSGRHAELRIAGQRCFIRDLGSANGTSVNGERITGPQEISARDHVQLGAAVLMLDAGLAQVMPAEPTAPYPAYSLAGPNAPPAQAEPVMSAVPKRLPWPVSVLLAGAAAIGTVALLMLFIEWYSQAEMKRAQQVARFAAFAAQYTYLLRQSPVPPLPAPVIDSSWLDAPVFVLDRDGKILYPAATGAAALPSPVLGTNDKVIEAAKSGLFRQQIAGPGGSTIRISTYPVTYNGDLLGFVAAQPVPGYSNFGLIALMILCAAAIGLFVLYFATRPVVNHVRSTLEVTREKLSAVAHGFIGELPRSARMPELNALVETVEHLVKTMPRGQENTGQAKGRGEEPYAALCAVLVDAARIPYCFVDGEFQLLSASREFTSILEFRSVRTGASIFERGMTTIQSKQIVRALADARAQGAASTTIALTIDGEVRQHVVHVKRMTGLRNEPIYGLLFEHVSP